MITSIKTEVPKVFNETLREYGIRKMASKIDISPSFLSDCLNNKEDMSWKVFRAIQDVLKDKIKVSIKLSIKKI